MKIALLFAYILIISVSCANVGKVTKVVSPKKVNKESLKSLPKFTTPKHKLTVSTVNSLRNKREVVKAEADKQFDKFTDCMVITDGGRLARSVPIAVVDGTFKCRYHKGRCNGEYDDKLGLIIVSYKSFNRKGKLPLLRHEWAHLYGFLKSDHSNLEKVKKCTKY